MDSLTTARVRIEHRRRRVDDCLCGGVFYVDRLAPNGDYGAHVRSRLHRAWWHRVEPEWHPWIADELAGL